MSWASGLGQEVHDHGREGQEVCERKSALITCFTTMKSEKIIKSLIQAKILLMRKFMKPDPDAHDIELKFSDENIQYICNADKEKVCHFTDQKNLQNFRSSELKSIKDFLLSHRQEVREHGGRQEVH